jgi:hypothetical protein
MCFLPVTNIIRIGFDLKQASTYLNFFSNFGRKLETGQFYFNLGVTFGEKIGAAIFFSLMEKSCNAQQ